MKENNIHLEIIETQVKNENNKINKIDEVIIKTKNNTINKINIVDKNKNSLTTLSQQQHNILNKLRTTPFEQKIIPDNETFLYEKKYTPIDPSLDNKYISSFENNPLNIPFSNIIKVNNQIFTCENDIVLQWRTKGNYQVNNGLITWAQKENGIENYNVDKIKNKLLKTTIISLPKNDYLHFQNLQLSTISILNQNFRKKWIDFKNIFTFTNSPIKKVDKYVYLNNTDDTLQIEIQQKNNTSYTLFKWTSAIQNNEVHKNNNNILLRPFEFFAIESNTNFIFLQFKIHGVKVDIDNEYISDWQETKIKKNTHFAFMGEETMGYQIKINYSKNIYNEANKLKNINKQTKKLEQDIRSSIIEIQENKLILELQYKKKKELIMKHQIINEKINTINILEHLNKFLKQINTNKNKIVSETNLENAKKILHTTKSIHDESVEYINETFKPLTFDDNTHEFVKNNLDEGNILEIIVGNYALIKKKIKDIEYQILNINQIELNIKELLTSNWIKQTSEKINSIKKSEQQVVVSIEKLQAFVKEKKINDEKLNQYYNILIIDYTSIIEKINDITDQKTYFQENDIKDKNLELMFQKTETIIDALKIKMNTLKSDIAVYSNRKRNIIETELEKIEIIEKRIEEENKKILSQQKNINDTELKYNNTIDIYNIILGKIQILTDYETNITNNIGEKDVFVDINSTYEKTNNIIMEINTSITDISNIHLNLLQSIKNAKNTIGQILYDKLIDDLTQIEQNINDTTVFDKTKLVDKINNHKKIMNSLTDKINALLLRYQNDSIKIEIENSTLLKSVLNKKQSIFIFYKYSKLDDMFQNVVINDSKCNDFAMDIIDYINLDKNFFDKLKNTNDKYNILLSYCEKTDNLYTETKRYLSTIIDEINCIKDDIGKIKYFLDLIAPKNKQLKDIKLDLLTSSKLIKQVDARKKDLQKQQDVLNDRKEIVQQKNSYIIDPIIVQNSEKQFFRTNNTTRKDKTRAIFTNGLPQIGLTDQLKFIMRYVYWPEATFIQNAGHSPQNETVPNNNRDIGMLGFKYSIKNNKLYIEFYDLTSTPPYSFDKSIGIAYYFDTMTNAWYLENSEKNGPNLSSLNWLKIWEFNGEPPYKNKKNDFFGWYLCFENNFPNNTSLQGNNINKTLVFEKNKFGKQSNNSQINSPRQIALLENASLLGWLGVQEQNRIKNLLDTKFINNINRKIATPLDFNYSNGTGIFILYPKEINSGSWRDKFKKNGLNFTQQKEYVLFTVQNTKNESTITFYNSINDKLNLISNTLKKSDIIHELKYIEFDNDNTYVLSQKNNGSYISKNIGSIYYKTSGPDINGKYTLIEQTSDTQVELIASPYILEKNLSKIVPLYTNTLQNTYLFSQNTALISTHETTTTNDTGKFDDKTYILELRYMDKDTFVVDDGPLGFISKYIYKPITEFTTSSTNGKYFRVSNIKNNTIDPTHYIELMDGILFPSKQQKIIIKRTIQGNDAIFELNNIQNKFTLYKQIEIEKKIPLGNFLITNPLWDQNITGNTFNCMKLVSNENQLLFYKIINKQFYDVGPLTKTFTFIPFEDYYKYYEVNDKIDFSLFTNNIPPPLDVYKIRIESNNPYPLELLNIDVFTSTNFDENGTPTGDTVKFQPGDTVSAFKFKNSKQNSTSNFENISNNAVNGITELDEYSQTDIIFTSDLKWFEVELDPPSIITAIHIHSRKNTLFAERTNSNIFLIDLNGDKINWSWQQNETFTNVDTKKIANSGTFATVKIDKNNSEQYSVFSDINTVQQVDYYSQTYFAKNKNAYTYRERNNRISITLDDWDNAYAIKQAEKLEFEKKYNSHFIPYGDYIVINSNWNYNWIVDRKFIVRSINDPLLNDVLNIYSINSDNTVGQLYFTYIYKNLNYYLNGNIESNSFFYLPNNSIQQDTRSYTLYENLNDMGDFISSEFNSTDLILQEYSYYITSINNALIEQKNLLDKYIIPENTPYLVTIKKDYFLLNADNTQAPRFQLYLLNNDFNVGTLENKVKSIKISFDVVNLFGFKVSLFDINDKEIPSKYYEMKIETIEKKIVVNIDIHNPTRIKNIKFNKTNNLIISMELFDSVGDRIKVRTNVNTIGQDIITFDNYEVENNNITIIDYIREYKNTTPNYIFSSIIEGNKHIYQSVLDGIDIKWVYNATDNNISTNFSSDDIITYPLSSYTDMRVDLFKVLLTTEKTIRNKLTDYQPEDFIVKPINKIDINFNSHSKNYFLLEKRNDTLSAYKIIDYNENIDPSDLRKVDDLIVYKFEWNEKTLFYENDTHYLTELYEPSNGTSNGNTPAWNIIIGDLFQKTNFHNYEIQTKKDYIYEKQQKNIEAQKEKEKNIERKKIPIGEYYLSQTNKKIISFLNNGIYNIEVIDTVINKDETELFKSLKETSTNATYELLNDNGEYKYILKIIEGHDFSNVFTTTIKDLNDWTNFYTITNNNFKNEYEILTTNLAELDYQSIEKEILLLDDGIVKNIGGQILEQGKWKYIFKNKSELTKIENDLTKMISKIDTLYETSNNTTNNLLTDLELEPFFMFNSQPLNDTLYKNIGPELWDDQFKFETDLTSIQDINFATFIPSIINDNYLNDYKISRETIIKKYNNNLKVKGIPFVEKNDTYVLIKKLLNDATKIKYYIRYKSDLKLINNVVVDNNIKLWNDPILPHKSLVLPNLNRDINNLKNITNAKKFINSSQIIKINQDSRSVELEYEKHYKYGSKKLREHIKIYINLVFRHNILYNTLQVLKEYGPTKNSWDFNTFDKDYIVVQKDINYFENINHKGPYEKEYNLNITKQELYELFVFTTFAYDNPFLPSNIDKFNILKKYNNIDDDYKKKIIEFYEKLFNIRRWQITLANKDVLNQTSPTDNTWNSEKNLLDSIKELDNVMDNVDILTQKKWKLIEKKTLNVYLNNHKNNIGSNSIRDNISLFYNDLEKLYSNISLLQQSIPIKQNDYLLLFKNKKILYVEILFNGEINIFSTDVFSRKNISIETLQWDQNKKVYKNNTSILQVISFTDKYDYTIKYNNNNYILIPKPTFYSYGNNNNFNFSLSNIEKEEFYKGNTSMHYNNFEWWKNGQQRGMNYKLGTNINSQYSVAKKAIRMPYLIYLRNNILLPLKGVNDRIIYEYPITIKYGNQDGAYAFSKNELIEKRNNLEWWLNEWTKPLHFDANENIEKIDKKNDGNVPNSHRWPTIYNTIDYFDNFISDDTVAQWITFLKKTNWTDETKKNITHKIIETAMFPIMERLTRHLTHLIDFCIKMQEIKEKKDIYINTLSKFITYNTTNDIEVKKQINKEFTSNDLNLLVNTQKNEIMNMINDFEFQKLYKIIKQINFNEPSTISTNIEENAPITDFMSNKTFDNHDFSSWERYREHGWKSYGHGSCGIWFNSAFDHPEPSRRGNLRFNNDLKEIFLNTNLFFEKIKNSINVDIGFHDHLRAINNSYANNYWFNDYIYCVELIIKKQYVELLKFENENSAQKIINTQNDKLLSTNQTYNNYKLINYTSIKEINVHHNNNRLYIFDKNIDANLYNSVKCVVDFTEYPNTIFLTLNKKYEYKDVRDIMDQDDVYGTNDDSFVAIYKGLIDVKDINNYTPIEEIKNINAHLKMINYDGNIVPEYSLPNLNNIKGQQYTIILFNKKKGSNIKTIFAVSKYKSFSPLSAKYNNQNIYLSFFKNINNNKLLIASIDKMVNYIDNEIKNNLLTNIITFFNNEKSILEKEKLNAQTQTIETTKKYNIYYSKYQNEILTDPLSNEKWNDKIIKIEADNKLVNTHYQDYLFHKSGWNGYISSFNNNINSYNLFYETNKIIIENTDTYVNAVLENISIINVETNLKKIKTDKNIYINISGKINNLNKFFSKNIVDYSKNTITSLINDNVNTINKFINDINDIKKFPFNSQLNDGKSYSDTLDKFLEAATKKQNILLEDTGTIINKYKNIINTMSDVNNVEKKIDKSIELSIIQEVYLSEYKKIFGNFDYYNIYFKTQVINITEKYKIVSQQYRELLDKYNKNIKNKVENFKNNDLNILNNDLKIINNEFQIIDTMMNLYDAELIKYEMLKSNANKLDLTIDKVATYIKNTDINTLETIVSKNKYINLFLLNDSIDNTSSNINSFLEIRGLYNQLKNYTNEINKINIDLPLKVKTIVNNLLTEFNKQYLNISTLTDKIIIDKNKYDTIFNNNINSLLFKLYDKNINSNRYSVAIDGVQKTFIYDINDQVYKNIKDTLKVNIFNWEGYKINIELYQSNDTVIKKQMFIKNTDINYYDNIDNIVLNFKNDKKIKDDEMKTLFTSFSTESNKLNKIGNEIIEYDWFIESNVINLVSQRMTLVNKNIDINKLYISEFDLQNYLFELYEKKLIKNKEKYYFYNNYTNISTVVKTIVNPTNTGALNKIIENIENSKNKIGKIYFWDNPTYTFEILVKKLNENPDINANDIINTYTRIYNFIIKNNTVEVNDITQKYKDSIKEKDIILSELNTNINDKKSELKSRYEKFIKNGNKLFDDIKKSINDKLKKIVNFLDQTLLQELNGILDKLSSISDDIAQNSEVGIITILGEQLKQKRTSYNDKKKTIEENIVDFTEKMIIIDKEINDLTKVINYNYTFINTLINDKKKVYDNSFLKSEINTFNAISRSNVDNKNKLTQQVNTIKNEKFVYLETFDAL